MIETKEQYELLLRKSKDRRILDTEDVNHFAETIEALRDSLKFVIRRYDIDGDALDELLDGLPDWITEE